VCLFQRFDSLADAVEKRAYLRIEAREDSKRIAVGLLLLQPRLLNGIGEAPSGSGFGVGQDLTSPLLRLPDHAGLCQAPIGFSLRRIDDSGGLLFSLRECLRAPLKDISRLPNIRGYGNAQLINEIEHVLSIDKHTATDRHFACAGNFFFEQIEQMQNIDGGPPWSTFTRKLL
jgi:hypothetical protein